MTRSTSSTRSWSALAPPLTDWVLDAIASLGFERMTPVQASTIPLFISHKDVVVEAVTGSGKTLAFLIPIIERLLKLEEPTKRHHVAAIIISPTRELATQIYGVLQSLLAFQTHRDHDNVEDQHKDISRILPQLLVGGAASPAQDLSNFLKDSPNVLVSTPGRLLELLSSPHVKCPQSSFEVLVLDEADRLLDLGFKDDLQKILTRLPKQRRTSLFSASVSEAVDQIVRVGLRNPVKVAVKVKGAAGKEDQRTPASLQMCYLTMPASHKIPMLCKLLKTLDPIPTKTIVYVSTCAAVDYLQHVLPSVVKETVGDVSLIPLHGKHPPAVRHKNFTKFSDATSPSILLTTDVAARGLDIPELDLVVQIDAPSDPKVFLHRCGRAGRAGRKGLAVVFLHSGREEEYVQLLDVRKTPVTPLELPGLYVGPEDAKEVVDRIRAIAREDRALHDKAQRGFVSWVRSYSKHQAGSIFRITDLDWSDLGSAWGLLRMPKMPELKNWEGDRDLGLGVDFKRYAYRDRLREKLRQEALHEESMHPNSVARVEPQNKRSWSDKLDRKDETARQREKRQKKRAREKWDQMTSTEREEQIELERMIEQVKSNAINDQEFQGFD